MHLQKIFLASPQLKLLQFYLLHRRRDQGTEMERAFLLLTPRPCKAAVPFSKGERKHCSYCPWANKATGEPSSCSTRAVEQLWSGLGLSCSASCHGAMSVYFLLPPSVNLPSFPSPSVAPLSFSALLQALSWRLVGFLFVCLLSSLLAFSSPGVFKCEAAGLILRHILIYF